MKIAILGVGNLGYSIAIGILNKKKDLNCKSLYLTKRNTKTLEHLGKLSVVKITSDNKKAVKYSDVIIVAVLPNQLKKVLEEIKEVIVPGKHTIISVATGREIAEIEAV
ncbi:MAG: NAD(P)-binding domain-containing protein, partial [Flavobacteriaceae bacterium]|nr:NAD(P)-binding domain-containing protein [Flavobacteriaceae bacterium]